MPSQLSVDLAPVTSLVHRRCGDPKAAVRRGALQLLEALLVMRASWQGYVRQLPGSADLALLEAATADPLVSVRKAALVALSTLLELFPAEPSLCHAWVASSLPLVRDVEASIQDSLADWAAALLFDKAAAAGAAATAANKKAGKKKASAAAAAAGAAGEADDMDWQGSEAAEAEEGAAVTEARAVAAAAFAELRQLLAAVAAVGRAAGACLGKLSAAMAGKKKLKAAAVARGLEAVIAGTPTGSSAALGAYVLLKEIAAQDPAAPSWQFLQQRWAAVRAAAASAGPASSQAGDAVAAAAGSAALPGQAAGGQAAAAAAAAGPAGLAEEAAALLLVISETAAGFPAEQARSLAAELLQHTLSFQLPPAAAGAHVAALYRLTEAAAGGAGGGSSSSSWAGAGAAGPPGQWAKQVFCAAHEQLRRYIDTCSAPGPGTGGPQADHSTCVAMFTVGDVALLKAAKPPSGLVVLLQALTAHKFIQSSSSYPQAGSQAPPDVPAGGVAAAGPEGSQAAAADGDGGGAVAAGAAAQGCAAGGARLVPACVQAHAWIALGKVCLVDESLAKKCVPLFVQELGRSSSPVVRNNIMVALSDMLIQYTALVDAHMPRLAACIRDRHELVRRQALALLANLLMKDYVKWRGPLFHRFLLALVDPSPAVRQLAEYLLRDTLAAKAPLLAYNHFVEALFVLNGCTAGLHGARLGANLAGAGAAGGGGLLAAAGTDGGGAAAAAAGRQGQEEEGAAEGEELSEAWMAAPVQFMLKGKQNRPARDLIYASLLRSMSPEHKFSSAAKLCGEVLAGVADGLLPLAECGEVLRDALCLLASKDIKVSASRLAAQDEDEPTQPSQATAGGGSATAAEAAARARGKLVSALMKRHLVEQVVPVLVELRRLLAELRHPLLVELMGCFAALLKEYKSEVEDILVADKQLAKEILYDIKQAEQAKQQQQQAGTAAAAAAAAAQSTAARAAGAAAEAAPGRCSPPPAGVMPGTPVAAEVLATAERQRRRQLEQLRQQQQAAAAAGDMPAPSPRLPLGHRTPGTGGNAAMLQTPAAAAGTGSRSRLASSSSGAGQPHHAAGSFETPAAKTPGTAAAAAGASAGARAAGAAAGTGTGFRMAVASPAPLTVAKRGGRGARGMRVAADCAGTADENAAPGGAAHCPPSMSTATQLLQRPSPSRSPTNVLLPSPYTTDTKRQWNIPQHVATGEKQQPRRARTGQQAAGTQAAAAEGSAAAQEGGGGAPATSGGRASRSGRCSRGQRMRLPGTVSDVNCLCK
ncbi:non-SMC mitotic condensation complex subunit 1-domain-containing protein [Scenedesmus sp. NREL 46B-D3]|nr:non-SMC mitotic condensation complex subunit 1-domain-containing protein [Scenedesmus sp. NREL 46B-D3]